MPQKLSQGLITVVFRSYQWFIGPALHLISGPNVGCRYRLTCSRLAERSLTRLGWAGSIQLILRRLLRCHPF